MERNLLKGTGVALVTPFLQQAVDYAALERLIEHVIAGGVDFIVSLGTTGEAITLSSQECREVFDFTLRQVNGRRPVVAGLFGSNYTAMLSEKIRHYRLDGFAAIMSSSPAYSKPSQEGIFQHYLAVATASPVPVIIYNVPGRTASNVHPTTVLRLADASPNFCGVKEASGQVEQSLKILKERPAGFLLWSGDDPLTVPLISCGADGAISVIANLFPGPFATMVRQALAGDFATAARINAQMLDIHPWLYAEGNPVGIKAALEIAGWCQREVRIPLTPLSAAAYTQLQLEIEKSGLLIPA